MESFKDVKSYFSTWSINKRIKALNTPADIYVINGENVPWLVEYYRNNWSFDMVVADEFSSFKNHSAKRFKSLSWVRKHITRFVGLTGTPVPNPGADESIKNLISDICVSMKAEDYLELPDCITVTVPVILDSKAKAAYGKLEKEMLLEIDENVID